MKRWQLLILIFELTLFAAILVLPQVALPDLAFHEGTAPVAARARVCDPAPGTAIAMAPLILPAEPTCRCAARLRMFRPRRRSIPGFQGCAF